MNATVEYFDDVSNPLDSVEEILTSHDWCFSRTNEDEIVVDIAGRHCSYRLFFMWQEEYSAMQFHCQYDLTVGRKNMGKVANILMNINKELWLGHFDVPDDSRVPTFRQTCLFRGQTQTSGADHVQDLVEIALAECERYYPVFHLLCNCRAYDDASLSLALMDIAGES